MYEVPILHIKAKCTAVLYLLKCTAVLYLLKCYNDIKIAGNMNTQQRFAYR
jgi:hypothetical protein